MRISIEQYKQILNKRTQNKYHAIETHIGGVRFPSIAEGDFYKIAQRMIIYKEIKFFLRQVPFHLPGNVKLVLDFLLFYQDGHVRFIDIKGGSPTQAFIIKRKQVEHMYDIKIEIITKKELIPLRKQYAIK